MTNTYRKHCSKNKSEKLAEKRAGKKLEEAVAKCGRDIQSVRPNKLSIVKRESMQDLERSFHHMKICGQIERKRYWRSAKKVRIEQAAPVHIPKKFDIAPLNECLPSTHYSRHGKAFHKISNKDLKLQQESGLDAVTTFLKNLVPNVLGISDLTNSVDGLTRLVSTQDGKDIRPDILSFITTLPATTAEVSTVRGLLQSLAGFSLVALGVTCMCIAAVVENMTVKILLSSMAVYCCWQHGLLKKALDFLMSLLGDPSKIESQAGLDPTFISGIFTSLWILYTGKPDASIPSKIEAQMRAFPKLQPTILQVTEWVLQTFDTIAESLASYFGVRKDFSFWKDPNVAVQQFINKAKLLVDGFNGDKLYKSLVSSELLKETIGEGEALIVNAKRSPTSSSVINDYLRKLREIVEYFTDNKLALDGLRQEPVCVLFRGAPGNFKTAAVQHLTTAIVAKVLQEHGSEAEMTAFRANPNDFSFNRQAENVFWEGYSSKAIVTTLDDFGQCRDQPGTPDNEYMNLIRMVNEFPMHCHMAAMSKKDCVFFGSKFVFATTNLEEFNPTSINSREAINRRFTFDIIVTPRPEYCQNPDAPRMRQTLNKSLLPTGELGVASNEPHEILIFHDTKSGRSLHFDGLVTLVYQAFLERKKWFDQKVQQLHNTRNFYAPVEKEEVETIFDLDFLDMEAEAGIKPVFDDLVEKSHKIFSEKKPQILEWIRRNFYHPNLFRKERNALNMDNIAYGASDVQTLLNDTVAQCEKQGEKVAWNTFKKHLDTVFHEPNEYSSAILHQLYEELTPVEFEKWFIQSYLSNYAGMTGKSFASGLHALEHMVSTYIPNYLVALTSVTVGGLSKLTEKLKGIEISIPQGIKDFMNDIYCFVTENKFLVLGAIGILSLLFGAVKLYNDGSAARTSRRMAQKYGDPVPQTVWDYDQNSQNIVAKIVHRNTYEMWICGREGKEEAISAYRKQLGYITFIQGVTAVMPFHFYREIRRNINAPFNDFDIELKSNLGEHFDIHVRLDEFMKAQDEVELLINQDLTLCVFPDARQHSTIIDFFKTESDMSKMAGCSAVLIHPSVSQRIDNHVKCIKRPCSYQDAKDGVKVKISHGFWYEIYTTRGDCGSLLIQIDPSIQARKLLGVHVAGAPNGGYGVSSGITQEMIIEGLKKISFKYKIDDSNFPVESQTGLDEHYAQFIGLGTVDKFPAGPVKSAFVPSRMHGTFCQLGAKPRKVPSLLRPKKINGVLVDPMVNGLANYGSPNCRTIVGEKLRMASEAYWSFLRDKKNSPHDIQPRILDHEEIVLGIKGEKLFKSVNRGSSLGYPYNASPKPGFKGKTFLLGCEQDYDLKNPEFLKFMENVSETEQMLFENKRPKFIFTDNLKDEKLKRQKVVEGKTRIFSAAPFSLVYLVRKYFGAFTLWFAKNNVDNGCAVGTNPYSLDWEKLAGKMLEKAGDPEQLACGAGDYSKFDGSEKARIHWAILEIIQKFYSQNVRDMTPEEIKQLIQECRVRHILWLEVVNSIHLVRGVLMMWCNSLPSGHPLTTVINNMYNHISMRYCWISGHENRLSSVWEFDKNVYLCTMGDDQIFSVLPAKRELYNEANIAEWMGELGLKYTSDTKDGVNLQLRKLTDITFLKRKFVFNNDLGRWLAPLDHDTIEEICYWTKTGANADQIVADHCDSMIMEWSLHGEEHFEKYVGLLTDSFREKYPNLSLRTTDYETALMLACEKEIDW